MAAPTTQLITTTTPPTPANIDNNRPAATPKGGRLSFASACPTLTQMMDVVCAPAGKCCHGRAELSPVRRAPEPIAAAGSSSRGRCSHRAAPTAGGWHATDVCKKLQLVFSARSRLASCERLSERTLRVRKKKLRQSSGEKPLEPIWPRRQLVGRPLADSRALNHRSIADLRQFCDRRTALELRPPRPLDGPTLEERRRASRGQWRGAAALELLSGPILEFCWTNTRSLVCLYVSAGRTAGRSPA